MNKRNFNTYAYSSGLFLADDTRMEFRSDLEILLNCRLNANSNTISKTKRCFYSPSLLHVFHCVPP